MALCGDVGWCKPARAIFDRAAHDLGVANEECVFVGDDLEWDIAGSVLASMRPILIDRDDRHPTFTGTRLRSLTELVASDSRAHRSNAS